MADTDTVAQAASNNNPTEVPKAEGALEVKAEEKAPKTDDAGEQKWELNDKSEEKNGRRHDREDRNGRFGRNDRRDNDRRDNNRGRGRGRGNFQNNKKRNDEFENLPETDDPVEIRGQVEFYFSSQNLATDEHLFKALEGPKNTPVPIKDLCTFKRMRRFSPYSAVVDALRDSKDLIVVDDGKFSGHGNEAVKRREPLVVEAKPTDNERPPTVDQLFHRLKNNSSNKLETSVYVNGFGNLEDAGQIAMEQFFRPYGAVLVRKRRNEDNSWKGSVFVEFDTEDSQKQFLALDPKPKFNDNELKIEGKKEYILRKCDEKGIKPDWLLTDQEKYEQRKKRREENGGNRGRDGDRRGGGRGRGRGGRGGRGGRDRRDRNRSRSPRRRRDRSGSRDSVDSRDWNTRRDRDQKGRDNKKGIERDAHGVPIVKDTRPAAEIAASNKRKAGDDDRAEEPKKSKIEIKQDE